MAKKQKRDKRPAFPGVNASPQKLAEYELLDNAWVERQIKRDYVKNIKGNNTLRLQQALTPKLKKK